MSINMNELHEIANEAYLDKTRKPCDPQKFYLMAICAYTELTKENAKRLGRSLKRLKEIVDYAKKFIGNHRPYWFH